MFPFRTRHGSIRGENRYDFQADERITRPKPKTILLSDPKSPLKSVSQARLTVPFLRRQRTIPAAANPSSSAAKSSPFT